MATVDFAAVRSMDDFLINPTTFQLDNRVRQSEMSDHEQYEAGTPPNVFVLKRNTMQSKNAEQAGALRDLPEDPAYWRSYNSDEEMASPIADDDMSFDSGSSSVDDLSDFALPEQLADSCHQVEHQCSKAQAVVLRPAGRPRVVSVGSPTSPRFPKFAQAVEIHRRPVPQRGASVSEGSELSNSEVERHSSIASSNGSQRSTAASSISEQGSSPQPRSIRRKPSQELLISTVERVPMTISSRRGSTPLNFMVPRSKPLMEAAQATPMSATFPQPSEYARRDSSIDSTVSYQTSASTAAAGQNRRRMQKISSTLNLNRFGARSRNTRSDSTRSSSAQSSDHEIEAAAAVPPPTPSRSAARLKLVPRGANERAPLLRLPPCPNSPVRGNEDADEEDEAEEELHRDEAVDAVWPLRIDSHKRGSHGLAIGDRWPMPPAGPRRRSLSVEVAGAWHS